jgi:hypothetical protein
MAGITINTNVAVPQQGVQVETPSERLAKQVPQPTLQPVVPEISAAEQEYFGGAATQAVPEVPMQRASAPEPQQFQFTSENIEDPTLANIPQVELTPELQGQELIKQQQRANYGNIDFETREELKGVFGDAIKATEEGTVWKTRGDLINSATKQSIGYELTPGKPLPVGTTGLNYIQNSLGLENKVQAANALTTAVLSFSQMLPATTIKSDVLSSEMDIEELFGVDNTDKDPDTIREMRKEVTPEQAAQFLGKALGERAKAAKAISNITPQDEDVVTSYEAAGQTALNAAIDSGLMQEVVTATGQKAIRLTPYGTEVAWNSRGLVNKLSEGSGGRSQIFPVTSTGDYQGVMSQIRRGDKIKQTIAKDKYQTPEAITQAKVIAGSIAKQIPTAKFTIVGLLAKLARQELEAGIALDEKTAKKTGAARLFNLDGKQDKEAKIALADLDRDLNYLAGNFLEGNPRYSQYFEDNSTHRLYDDSTDANMQRSKTQRAVYVGTPTPIQVKAEPFVGVSLSEAKAFWSSIAQGNWDKKAQGKAAEMNFLLTIGHVMSPDTDDKTVLSLFASVTPEKMEQYADIGKKLIAITRMISDEGKLAVAEFAGTSKGAFDVNQLPQELQAVIKKLITDPEFDRENFGYKLQGYIDAYNYLQAKQNGTAFTPFVTTAIDMNSAGRAFLAMDVGNLNILERVGLIWNYTENELTSTQPFGNPRSFFVQATIDKAVNKVFNSSKPEVINSVKNLFSKYKEDKNFTKSYAKSVLLTTDYGKAAQYHVDDARKFLLKNPEFAEELALVTGLPNTLEPLAELVNKLYYAGLTEVTDSFQYALPKDMVRSLQMVGSMFSFKGMFNETIPLGGSMFMPTGDSVLVSNPTGDTKKINLTRTLFDPLAKAEQKAIKKFNKETGQYYEEDYNPDLGSAAANQIGPLFGQYRESMVLIDTMLAVNGSKAKATDMLFVQPVFDNFILDSQSLAQFMYYANNKAAPKVLNWDIQTPIWEDFSQKLIAGIKEVEQLGTVMIPKNGKYYGVFSNIDREYKFLKEKDAKDLSPREKMFMKSVEEHGYEYVEDRDNQENFVGQLTGKQIGMLVKDYILYKEIMGRAVEKNARSKKEKWIDEGLKKKKAAMASVQKLASEDRIYFMN